MQGGGAGTVNTCPSQGFAVLCNITPGAFVGGIISFMFVIAGIVTLFYLVWGGFKWITSGGDKTAIESARGHIIAAVVGLIVIFLAYVIMNLVWQFFFKTSFTQVQLPTL